MLPFSPTPRLPVAELFADRDPQKKIESLLTFASFAPSVHNTQPWRVCIHSPEQLTIFLEKNIQLPKADPTGRGGFLALGGFAANLAVAAEHCGQTLEMKVEKNDTDTVLRVLLKKTKNQTNIDTAIPFLSAIRERTTSRGMFRPLPSPETVIAELNTPQTTPPTALHFICDTPRLKKIAELIREGTLLAYGDHGFCAEHAAWVRPNWTFRRDGIPGYAIGIPTPLSFLVPFAIRHKDMRVARADQEYTKANSTNLFAVLATTDDSPPGWIAAGRRLQRLLIDVTRLGFVQSPNAAPVEMGTLSKDVTALAEIGGVPQLLIRIGLGATAKRFTPRRPVMDFLRSALP